MTLARKDNFQETLHLCVLFATGTAALPATKDDIYIVFAATSSIFATFLAHVKPSFKFSSKPCHFNETILLLITSTTCSLLQLELLRQRMYQHIRHMGFDCFASGSRLETGVG